MIVRKLLGEKMMGKKGKDSMTWTVVDEHDVELKQQNRKIERQVGMKGLDQLLIEENFIDPSVASSDGI